MVSWMAAEVTRFEDFELDRGAFELRRKGRPVRLERIPLEMLFLLVERRGLLVGREEILERVWGKDVFVDADNSINTAVRKIRQALGDNPEEPRFVLTVPGKGYRFAASVVVPAPPAPLSPKPVVEAEGQAEGPSVARPLRYWLLWIAIVVLLGAAASVAGLILKRNSKPASTKTMLVVLPFVNLSDDPQQEYFADGMTEEMITQLGNLDPEHLGVIARTSSMQYKHTQKRASQIAQELGVNYLLEGSVRRDGNKVRVTGQLIRANDETHVWAGELKLARQLIDAQTAERFDPTSFKDDVRERIRAAIDRKVEGQAITVSEEPVESGGKVIDLMEALRASLEKTTARAPASRLGPRKEPKRVEEAKRVEPAAKPARKTGRR